MMRVELTVELKASPGFSDQLVAAEQELKSVFATVCRTEENAPSVGLIAKGVCRGERAMSLIENLPGFSRRHPEILIFLAYEMDVMWRDGGYVVYYNGRKLVDATADCEHLGEKAAEERLRYGDPDGTDDGDGDTWDHDDTAIVLNALPGRRV